MPEFSIILQHNRTKSNQFRLLSSWFIGNRRDHFENMLELRHDFPDSNCLHGVPGFRRSGIGSVGQPLLAGGRGVSARSSSRAGWHPETAGCQGGGAAPRRSIIQPEKLRQPEATQQLRDWAPDLIVVAAFGQILRPEVLDLPKWGCINIHGSLLPRGHGAAPVQAAILAGDQKRPASPS